MTSTEHNIQNGDGQNGDGKDERRLVVVRGTAGALTQEVTAGPHRILADEPEPLGSDAGFSTNELLAAALGACTSMTLSLYARRKDWPLENLSVVLAHDKVDTPDGKKDQIERVIELGGPLTEEQRSRLLDIAEKCPVCRMLRSGVQIETRLAE